MTYRWISFTTDYGTRDGFVAACHGVLARLAPDVRVLDVTHEVPAQDVRRGAETLAQTVAYLPTAIHLAVVDPGVGTRRRGVVVVAADGLLVGPDNGLLLPAADALGGVRAAFELTEPGLRLPTVSNTFHGRDVFAPAAAHLALGTPPADFGPPIGDLLRLSPPVLRTSRGELVAQVLGVDTFGNVQLAAAPEDLAAAGLSGNVTVRSGQSTDAPATLAAAIGGTFADVPVHAAVLLTDSAGRLAVAVNQGSAARALRLGDYSSDSPRLVTISSSPTESLPGRNTAALTPKATPPSAARR